MYYAMRASAPSLHRESTDSLIITRKKKFCELKKREYRDGVKSEETR